MLSAGNNYWIFENQAERDHHFNNLCGKPGQGRGLILRPPRLKMVMFQPSRPKTCLVRPLRLKMNILRYCANEEVLRDFARPEKDLLRPLRLKMIMF